VEFCEAKDPEWIPQGKCIPRIGQQRKCSDLQLCNLTMEKDWVMTEWRVRKEDIARRRQERLPIQNDTFVVLKSEDTKVGRIVDISMVGLTFHYVGRAKGLSKSAELGIFSAQNDFYLYRVPCEVVSDRKLYEHHPSPISMRRCGVQFRNLTQRQVSQLQDFIQSHAGRR
jgi:c-di-GMP-binding flagellar brake protein YcgR